MNPVPSPLSVRLANGGLDENGIPVAFNTIELPSPSVALMEMAIVSFSKRGTSLIADITGGRLTSVTFKTNTSNAPKGEVALSNTVTLSEYIPALSNPGLNRIEPELSPLSVKVANGGLDENGIPVALNVKSSPFGSKADRSTSRVLDSETSLSPMPDSIGGSF